MKPYRIFPALSAVTVAFALYAGPVSAQTEAEDCAKALESGAETDMSAFKKNYPNATCANDNAKSGATGSSATGGDTGGGDAGGGDAGGGNTAGGG